MYKSKTSRIFFFLILISYWNSKWAPTFSFFLSIEHDRLFGFQKFTIYFFRLIWTHNQSLGSLIYDASSFSINSINIIGNRISWDSQSLLLVRFLSYSQGPRKVKSNWNPLNWTLIRIRTKVFICFFVVHFFQFGLL